MKTAFDTTKYMALPFKNKGRTMEGVDCWGLCLLVYKNEYGTELPSMEELYTKSNNGKEVSAVVGFGKDHIEYIQKEMPEYGDLVIFNMKGNPCHVGIYIGFNRVLHILAGTNSVCERLNSVRLKGRVEGYYDIRTKKAEGCFI